MMKKITPAIMMLFALNGAMAQRQAHHESVKLGCKDGEPTHIVWQAEDLRFNKAGNVINHTKTTIDYDFASSAGVILQQKKGADYCTEQPYKVTKPAEKFTTAAISTCAFYKGGREIRNAQEAKKGTTEYCLTKPFSQLVGFSKRRGIMVR